MRIVQTCWACNHPDLLSLTAGWYGPEYHLMSWALSALQLRQYYTDVVLYADSASAATLIDQLQLPYTEVHCELDNFSSLDPGLWALPKIHVYSQQEQPFLHVDGDVFIWRPFDEALLASDLIAQNIETESSYYETLWDRLAGTLEFLPEEMREEQQSGSKIIAYNAGIFGGADIAFFKDYTAKAIEFVNNNRSRLGLFNAIDLNELFEQYLFFCMAKQRHKTVDVLLPEQHGGQQYLELVDFAEAPHNKKYLHLLRPFKSDGLICDLMASRLRMDYPEYYYRIISLFKTRRASLKRDYYQGVESFPETDLTLRRDTLRDNFLNGSLSLVDAHGRRRTFECQESRTALVQQAVDAAGNDVIGGDTGPHLSDVQHFEENIAGILQAKFCSYSSDYLYGRDLTLGPSFQLLFGDRSRSSGYAIALITEPGYEIISSQFDWSGIGPDEAGQKALKEQLESEPSTLYTAIIPEAHAGGYSLANLDDLDLQLLDVFKEPHTINAALSAMESLFDEADLRDARTEFEALITGRIKWALKHKLLGITHFSPNSRCPRTTV